MTLLTTVNSPPLVQGSCSRPHVFTMLFVSKRIIKSIAALPSYTISVTREFDAIFAKRHPGHSRNDWTFAHHYDGLYHFPWLSYPGLRFKLAFLSHYWSSLPSQMHISRKPVLHPFDIVSTSEVLRLVCKEDLFLCWTICRTAFYL